MSGRTQCHSLPASKVALLFLGRKRPGFDPDWGREIEAKVRSVCATLPHEFVEPSTRAVDDASLRAALEECRRAGASDVVVLQPTMSDGRLAPILAQMWGEGVILWATPERPTGEMISACSLVGAHAFAATLRQLGKPFEIVYGNHDWSQAVRQLDSALAVNRATRALAKGKIGLIGSHAPGFIDMHPDPFALSRTFGTEMLQVGLHEFVETIHAQTPDDVKKDLLASQSFCQNSSEISAADLEIQSRYYLALRQLMASEHLDGVALRCWPELPQVVGHWPYLALARLASECVPLACEGDLDGALGAFVAAQLGMGPAYLTDWLEHDTAHITVWHGGMAPLSLCDASQGRAPRLAKHFNSKKPTVIDATLDPEQPVTLFRFWLCDGRYHLAVMEGNTVLPERHLLGTNGRVHIPGKNLFDHFETLCHAGMPHHLAVTAGHHARTLQTLARRLGISTID